MYLFRASIYLIVFAGGYYILMRNNRAPLFNRIYILGSFLYSLIFAGLPSISLAGSAIMTSQEALLTLPEVVVRAADGTTRYTAVLNGAFHSLTFLPHVFFTVGLLILLIFSVNLIRIIYIIYTRPGVSKDNMYLVLFNEPISPFSFFRYVFVTQDILRDEGFSRVLAHEKAHYLRGHSWDSLFMEGLRIVFWFHPAYYYLRHALRAQHEFEADMIACRSIRKADYQMTLLEYTLSGRLLPLTNPFNVSLIKKRIMMMNHKTNQSPARLWLKTMVLLPFLMMAIFVQSCQEKVQEEASSIIDVEAADVKPNYADDVIFTVVEQPPVFTGGEDARIGFLQKNLDYPASARELGVQGTVFVSFVVRKDGNIDDVKVLRGAGHELEVRYAGSEHSIDALRAASQAIDDEALRVVKMMPKWTPGHQRGQAVSVQFNMPIRFALN